MELQYTIAKMTTIGYCGNVHPVSNLRELVDTINGPTMEIAQQLHDLDHLALGLWLPQTALGEALSHPEPLRQACEQKRLKLVSFNGFPMGRFHNQTVKEKVYTPDWTSPQRLQYTQDLARLGQKLGAVKLNISSLSGGYRPLDDPEKKKSYRQQWLKWTAWAHGFEEQTGCLVQLAIEPEPFNTWEDQRDAIDDWKKMLSEAKEIDIPESQVRRHLGLCFDCCHFSVRFIDPLHAWNELKAAGLPVHKIQVSVAPQVDGDDQANWKKLREMAEPVYLHQTYHKNQQGEIEAYSDLNQVPKNLSPELKKGTWRTHFHLPIHWGESPLTTGPECARFLKAIAKEPLPHLEVETYSFGALSQASNSHNQTLTESIIEELKWLQKQIAH
jgi:hypothetical protein